MSDLGQVRGHIRKGEMEQAYVLLAEILTVDCDNIDAWMMLAEIVEDIARQAECLQHVLRIDPTHAPAAAALENLRGKQRHLQDPPSPETEKEWLLRCPTCGGTQDVRFLGELCDKRAVCQYCQTEVDIPDKYRRVKRMVERQDHPWGYSTVETSVYESRADRGEELTPLPAEVMALFDSMRAKNIAVYKEETVKQDIHRSQASFSRGNVFLTNDPRALRIETSGQPGCFLALISMLFPNNEELAQRISTIVKKGPVENAHPDSLSRELRVHYLDVIPASERMECPYCSATVSKQDDYCPWCSADFSK